MTDLAFSTNAYTNQTLPEAVSRIAAHGYDGVELLADEPHAYFPDFDDENEAEIRATLVDADISVSNINANTAMGYYTDAPPSAFFEPSIITDDEQDRAWRIGYTKRAIDLADSVGSPSISVTTGRPLAGNPPDSARQYLHESLSEILDYAEINGVNVGIEFEPELLVECTDDVLELLDEIGHDLLGVNLDIGHAAVYGEDIVETIHRSAGHITGIHLEDIAGGRRGKHYHRIPGDGDIDFRAVFDALDDIGYDGYATLELYTYPDEPDRAATRAYEKLSKY